MYSARSEGAGRLPVWLSLALLVWGTTAQADETRLAPLPARFAVCCAGRTAGQTLPGRLRPQAGSAADRQRGGKKGRRGSWLGLSAALAVSSGIAAWWSKEQADRAYDRYLHAASLRRQQDQFARAEQYDRIAGAALLGMEAGLVATTLLIFLRL
jgi:hypothetical protein